MLLYFFYLILSPILWIILIFSSIFNHKIRTRFRDLQISWESALIKIKQEKSKRKLIILHAASAGEFEQLKPILRRIDHDKYFVLQSFFSPTIFEKEKDSSLFDAVCYLPFDFAGSVYLFFKKFQPEILIITRHDIWPTHLFFAKLFKVKTYLINGNLYDESSRLKWPLKALNSWVFKHFDLVIAGSERLANNFKKLVSNDKIITISDTRFDQIIERKKQNKTEHFPKNICDSKNIIFGSIIESDFDVVFGAIKIRYPNGDKSLNNLENRLIFVPHEVDEKTLLKIENKLAKNKISAQRFSQMKDKIEANAVIVDSVGILADLYKYADLAYIGAGFGAGVHSVIEPAVYGCAVSFGPNIKILDEAISMHNLNLGKMTFSANDLAVFFNLMNNSSKLKMLKEATFKFVEDNSHGSEKIIKLILE